MFLEAAAQIGSMPRPRNSDLIRTSHRSKGVLALEVRSSSRETIADMMSERPAETSERWGKADDGKSRDLAHAPVASGLQISRACSRSWRNAGDRSDAEALHC